eukprot:jgi/Chlat1/3845/Chrsp26S04057
MALMLNARKNANIGIRDSAFGVTPSSSSQLASGCHIFSVTGASTAWHSCSQGVLWSTSCALAACASAAR